MRFDEKARENLEAAERLLPDETGLRDPLSNAAASRAYYAAYLAIADCAQQQARGFTSKDATYYRHDSFPDDARGWGIIDYKESEYLRLLYQHRLKADYLEDSVDLEEASYAVDLARELLDAALERSAR